MKKALCMILFSVFAFISFCIIVIFAGTSKDDNITVLIAQVFIIFCFYFPTILFYLLYVKEKNKKLSESEKNYKGLRRFGKINFVCFLFSALEGVASSVVGIYTLIKYRDVYAYLNVESPTKVLPEFVSYSLLCAIFLVSYLVITHFLKKWERPASLQSDSEK